MRTIAQTAALMAILTLVSKCIGFIREMVMANYFGTTYITDAYVIAIAIPSIIFGGILVAVSTSYMPTLSNIIENKGKNKGSQFTSEVINILLVLSILSTTIGFIFSDQLVSIFASGFKGETANLASFYVKITFSYIFFTSISSILDAYLQYKGSFLPPIITGYLLSGCTIVAIIICAYTSHYYLAFGMLSGYALRFIIIVIVARRQAFKYEFIFKFESTVKRIFVIAFPVFIGSSLQQINTFIDKTLASSLKEGSVSALNYAHLLNTMIMGITITVLTTIIYPKLSQAHSLKDYNRFSEMIGTAFNLVIIISLPCSLGAMFFNNQIVQIVYERGAFNEMATAMTGSAFLFYALGLTFISLNELLSRTYYAMHDMKTPMICAGINVIINIVLNMVLVRMIAHNGLALATSIAGMCNFIFLYFGLKKKYPYISIIRSKEKLLKIIVSSIIAVGGSALFYNYVIMSASHIVYIQIFQLFLAVVVACVLYYILLVLFKIEELIFLKQLFRIK